MFPLQKRNLNRSTMRLIFDASSALAITSTSALGSLFPLSAKTQSRKASGKEKEAVKARLSEITGRMKTLRREVRLCEGIEARSDTLKENLKAEHVCEPCLSFGFLFFL